MSGSPAEGTDAPSEASPPTASSPTPSSDEPAPMLGWDTITAYFRVLDFGRMPDTKLGWAVRFSAVLLTIVLLWQRVNAATAPMLLAKPPSPIPTQELEGDRFRLPERTRREIFTELATAELAERERAITKNTWNGHAWSREDDRGHYERVAARAVASKYRVSLSQVYLVLDEGLRNHWPAPNGEPLPATTPPLSIRSTW